MYVHQMLEKNQQAKLKAHIESRKKQKGRTGSNSNFFAEAASAVSGASARLQAIRQEKADRTSGRRRHESDDDEDSFDYVHERVVEENRSAKVEEPTEQIQKPITPEEHAWNEWNRKNFWYEQAKNRYESYLQRSSFDRAVHVLKEIGIFVGTTVVVVSLVTAFLMIFVKSVAIQVCFLLLGSLSGVANSVYRYKVNVPPTMPEDLPPAPPKPIKAVSITGQETDTIAKTNVKPNDGINWNEADPFIFFGLNSNSSEIEIKKAYHEMISQYHPDKVAALAAEFRSVADEKTKRINESYEACLRKKAG